MLNTITTIKALSPINNKNFIPQAIQYRNFSTENLKVNIFKMMFHGFIKTNKQNKKLNYFILEGKCDSIFDGKININDYLSDLSL